MSNHQADLARAAIKKLNDAWGQGQGVPLPELHQLTDLIARSAVIDQNQDAINWLTLLNWEPQQLRN